MHGEPGRGVSGGLDRSGNHDGAYDIGDALLYLRRGGGDAVAARVEGLLRVLTIPAPGHGDIRPDASPGTGR